METHETSKPMTQLLRLRTWNSTMVVWWLTLGICVFTIVCTPVRFWMRFLVQVVRFLKTEKKKKIYIGEKKKENINKHIFSWPTENWGVKMNPGPPAANCHVKSLVISSPEIYININNNKKYCGIFSESSLKWLGGCSSRGRSQCSSPLNYTAPLRAMPLLLFPVTEWTLCRSPGDASSGLNTLT